MLVFSRGEGESFWVGSDVKVVVLGFGPGARVRFGVEAPKEVSVDRTEVRMMKLNRSKEGRDGLDKA